MSKRLDITLFGTSYIVGALYLFRDSVKAGLSAYGQKKWHSLISDIAIGSAPKKLQDEVGNTVGQPLRPIYHAQGIALHQNTFGIEVFHGGNFAPVQTLESENRTLQPAKLMRQCGSGDMLAVFWAKRDGAIFFRWDDVEDLNGTDIALAYDSLAPLIGRKNRFELVLDVTWRGERGKRKDLGNGHPFATCKHVLHKAK